jgi:asparagine synthase (glutamine-hydrolysing)
MSGIMGMVDWRGAPVKRESLQRMMEAAAHRGPDGRGIWQQGKVGLGFLALELTPEAVGESAPLARGELTLVADARIDNRGELIPLLRSRGQLRMEAPSDAELILAAYRVWGSSCARHLVGDFAFVLWDAEKERLFGARDPMGMRPLYYREEPGRFLFASEVKQILALPEVPARVFEPALLAHIAGPYGRPEWSFYEGVRQLAPGHALVAESGNVRVHRFWEVDPAARIEYRREEEYGEHFRALFQEAVACRLRSHRPVGLLLSGGVDSGSIAAMAGWLTEEGEGSFSGFRAYCWAFNELRESDERAVSDVILDRYRLDKTDVPADEGWPLQGYPGHPPDRDDPHLWVYQPLFDHSLDRAKEEGMGSVFSGDRGDEMVGDWVWDHPGMFLAGRWSLLRKEFQALGERGWRGMKRRVLNPLLRPGGRPKRDYPLAPWLAPEAVSRWGLAELARESSGAGLFQDPARQMRYGRIFSLPGMRIALANERRRAMRGLGFADPWADTRLVRFILSLPQWQVNRVSEPKRVAREGLRGVMPEEVRMRTGKTIPHGLFERGFMDRGLPAVRDLLREPISEQMGLLDAGELRRQYDALLKGQQPQHDFWWPLTAEFWLRSHWG